MTLALVIGKGEIGTPLYQLLKKAHGVNQVKIRDVKPKWKGYEFDFLHICFPQTIEFVGQVADYVSQYNAKIVIIHSTLSPGMSGLVARHLRPDPFIHEPGVFYSPVRGNARDGMTWGLKTYTKYLAPVDLTRLDEHFIEAATKHLEKAGMNIKKADEWTLEYAKLFNLAYYAICITTFQEIERIVASKKLDYALLTEFITSTQEESEGKVPRPLYYGDYIGGRCVIPAVEKIVATHDIPLFRAVLDSNIRRRREITFLRS